MRLAGASMVSFSVAAIIFSYAPLLEEEFSQGASVYARVKPVHLPSQGQVESGPLLLPRHNVIDNSDRVQVQVEAQRYGVNSSFSIVIPKIDVASVIIRNVDAGNRDEYLIATLKGVAHAYGSRYPGESGVGYYFAHSTNSVFNVKRFNAVFYRLRELTNGDLITLFYRGERYVYRIVDTRIVEDDDTSWLSELGSGERIVLQTSHPPGTIWKRLLVVGEPV